MKTLLNWIVSALGVFPVLAVAQPIVADDTVAKCDRSQLKSRVALLYRAAAEMRWDDVYSFVAPETKQHYTLDTFVEKFQRLQPNRGAEVRVTKIECDALCADESDADTLSAQVWMKVRVDYGDGRHETYRRLYDCWVNIADDWYWVYGSTEGCERPNFRLQATAGGGRATN